MGITLFQEGFEVVDSSVVKFRDIAERINDRVRDSLKDSKRKKKSRKIRSKKVKKVVKTEDEVLSSFRLRSDNGDKIKLLVECSSAVVVNDIPYTERRSKFDREYKSRHDKGVCFACNNESEHYHHIILLKHGGSNSDGNLVWLCGECHKKVHPWLYSVNKKMKDGSWKRCYISKKKKKNNDKRLSFVNNLNELSATIKSKSIYMKRPLSKKNTMVKKVIRMIKKNKSIGGKHLKSFDVYKNYVV